MKKQIFKLTSILLAMVMVFTMFTIVPISAEEPTVDKETAVQKLKTAAAKIVTSSAPVAHAAGYFDGQDRINFETDKYTYYTPGNEEYQTYGTELSPEYMLPAQSGRTLKGIWITGAVADMKNSLAVYFGDTVNDEAYISVYVKNVANPNASPSLNFYTRWQDGTTQNPSGVYTVNVVKGETYEIKLTDILTSNGINVNDLTADNKKYIHFFALQAGGCDITVQVGAMMTKHYYDPNSSDLVELTDVEFVKAMNDLKKGDDYASYSNTNEFEAALEVALKAFPEIAAQKVIDSAADYYTFEATVNSHDDVLVEARMINTSKWDKATANTFKKAVKALENQIGADFMPGYIAGNWYESGLTLKDLSVLSRYNDDPKGDKGIFDENVTFIDKDAIGNLTEESIRKSLLGIQ